MHNVEPDLKKKKTTTSPLPPPSPEDWVMLFGVLVTYLLTITLLRWSLGFLLFIFVTAVIVKKRRRNEVVVLIKQLISQKVFNIFSFGHDFFNYYDHIFETCKN